MRALAMLLLLGVAQHLWRPAPPTSGVSLHQRFPGVAQTMLLGGVRPLLVQYLWWHLEDAYRRGEMMGVLRDLRLLAEVELRSGRAARYLARFLAYDLAPREPNSAGRMARLAEALELLDRWASRLPRDPKLPQLKGLILQSAWAVDPTLHQLYRQRYGETPAASAVQAYRLALERDPQGPGSRHLLAAALREHGIERLHQGDRQGAVESLAEACGLLQADLRDGDVMALLAQGWHDLAAALASGEEALGAEAVNKLARTLGQLPLPGTPGTGAEDALLRSVLPLLVGLAHARAREGVPAHVLSLLEGIHRMHTLLEERSAQGEHEAPPELDVLTELRSLARVVVERAPELQPRVPPALRPSGR